MIALLGKHLRKWLLGLALAVRNLAHAVVAQIESVEAERAQGADREVAPSAAKTARSGEPPAHWVQLVKRHAPELLYPGLPYAAFQVSSQVFETDAGGDESVGANTKDPTSANGAIDLDEAKVYKDLAFSLELPRLSREHSDPPVRRPTPTLDEKRQTSDSDKSPEADAMPPRDNTAPHTREATPARSINVHRSAVSEVDAEKTTHRRFSSIESNSRSIYPQALGPWTRKAEIPVAWVTAARRFPSAAGHIEKNRPGKRESKNIRQDPGENFQPPSQTGKGVEHFDLQADDHQTVFQFDTRTAVHRVLKQEAAYESEPRPSESSIGLQSFADSEVKTSASQIKISGDDRRHVKEAWKINGQRQAHPLEDRINADEKRYWPPDFHWPDLPGEKGSEDAGDSNLSPSWPSLPEAQSAAAESLRHRSETPPSEAESRNIERLRRLDEEQRGISWSASHF